MDMLQPGSLGVLHFLLGYHLITICNRGDLIGYDWFQVMHAFVNKLVSHPLCLAAASLAFEHILTYLGALHDFSPLGDSIKNHAHRATDPAY